MKRQVDINKVAEMMQLTQQYGMESGTFIMVGYPTETKEDIHLTIDYLKRASPNHFTITVAYPIKGTGLYNQIEKDITVQPEWSTSTDREIDFKRTYPRKYYDYAVRRIVNEINYYQSKKIGQGKNVKSIIQKLKSIVSYWQMKRYEAF